MSKHEADRAGSPRSVAATFASSADAERCVAALEAAGVQREQIQILTEDDRGAMAPVEREVPVLRGTKLDEGGHLVEVDVTDGQRNVARRVLSESGGTLVNQDGSAS